MQRPLFSIGTAYIFTLMILALTGVGLCTALLIVSALLSGLLFFYAYKGRKKNGRNAVLMACILLSCAAACSAFLIKTYAEYRPAVSMAGKQVRVEGLVTEVLADSKSGSHRCIITGTVSGMKNGRKLKIKFSSGKYQPKLNDWLSFDGTLYEPGEKDPEIKGYWKSKRLYLGAYTFGSPTVSGLVDAPLSSYEKKLRKVLAGTTALRLKILETVRSVLSEPYASVLGGMLTGDRTGMDENLKNTFKTAGILHIFAVSGFHTALWAMLLYRALLRCGIKRNVTCSLCIAFLMLFTAMTGFSGSCIRASVMLTLFFLGRMITRKPDSLNSLGLSALIITGGNPFSGGDSGILLSFFATLGILWLYPKLMKPVKKKLKGIENRKLRNKAEDAVSILLISVSTFIFTLPCVMLCFGGVSLIAPLSNLLVTSVSSAAILLSGIGTVCSCIPVVSLITRPLFLAAGLIVKYMIFVCGRLAEVPFAYVGISGAGFQLAAAVCLLLLAFGILLFFRETFPVRLTAALCAVIVLSSVLSEELLQRCRTTVTFADVGSGTCIVVCSAGNAAVIGCGGDYRVSGEAEAAITRNNASKLAAVIVPRAESSESSGFEDLLEKDSPALAVVPVEYEPPAAGKKTKILKADAAEIDLLPQVKLKLDTSGDTPAAFLDAAGLHVLILFRPHGSAEEIRSKFGAAALNADILYCRADVPAYLDASAFARVIVSTDKKDLSPLPCMNGAVPLALASPGGVEVQTGRGRYRMVRLN